MKKIFFVLLVLLFSAYFYFSYSAWYKSDNFRIFFLDVGQGDSSLIVTPNGKTILIDGGPDAKVLNGLGKVLPFWQRQIDLLVITHTHDDHIVGLIEVCRRYKIKQVLYNNLEFNTPVLDSLIKIFKKEKIPIFLARENTVFNFNKNCALKVLSASKDLESDENDYSIVTRFNCLGKTVLFTGDAGIKIEKKLIDLNFDIQADILKVAHHGSNTASSESFLQKVNPKLAVVSVGVNNKFKHPSLITLERLRNLSVDIYRTDEQGIIGFLANNKIIKLLN